MPVRGGPRDLIAAGRALDDAGIELDDLEIRRPSLDDVFLALTGRPAAPTVRRPGERFVTDLTAGRCRGRAAHPTAHCPGHRGITRRNLLRIFRTPQLLFMSILQPTIILLLFRYVLGGAIVFPAWTMSTSSSRASSWRLF